MDATSEASDLTLGEKASLLTGRDFWSTTELTQHGLPSVVMTDGPHGVRLQAGDFDGIRLHLSVPATCFPTAVAVGSSWDPALAESVGAAIGREARALGVHVVLGPGVNIKRSPLCGRSFEYYSEDPLLAGALGGAHVRGQQGAGVGACVKHFAANNQETERMRVSADVDERTLREIYLAAFEQIVKEATPAVVMCSYNKINGVPASENSWLLTDVLRGEWDFQGCVVSDWGAVDDRVRALLAGLDLEMPSSGPATARRIVAAAESGQVSTEALDRSANRVMDLGRFARVTREDVDLDAHHELARSIAEDCIVLLRNDRDALPLSLEGRIAVIGGFAATPRFQGGGSSLVNATRAPSALDALTALTEGSGGVVTYTEAFASTSGGDVTADALSEAIAGARAADVAVIFAGLTDVEETEGQDRKDIALPAAQVEVIQSVAEVAPRTVVVLTNGGVVSLEGWHDDVDAIVEGFLLGQAGGEAVARMLVGAVNPSGHLAETIPTGLAQTSSFINFPGELGHVRYGEGPMVGYRWHETTGVPVRYPFGHGLSYTTFATVSLAIQPTGDDSATAEVAVRNVGERAGKHVVQLYVETDAGPVRRPRRELRAFQKLHLGPGEERSITFQLGSRSFAYFDVREHAWIVPAGNYHVQIGQNASAIVAEQVITLAGNGRPPVLTFESSLEEMAANARVGERFVELLAAVFGGIDLARSMIEVVGSMPVRRLPAMSGGTLTQDAIEQLLTVTGAGTGSA